MQASSATASRRPSAKRGAARSGRPPRGLAGEVEERILDAATNVFLQRGFEGASVDEIADVARAGKPSIYARFPGKEALFIAVAARMVRRNTSVAGSLATTGFTLEERLASIATAILQNVLTPETIGLIRMAIAEARRFPELASSVSRMARERATEAVTQLLGELAGSDVMALPAFAAEHRAATARHFRDLILLPLMMRALFGEDLAELHAEISPHVSQTVAFFLAACRQDQPG
jgi:AcrR family transcriptional regulator